MNIDNNANNYIHTYP